MSCLTYAAPFTEISQDLIGFALGSKGQASFPLALRGVEP
jgi:hypothetical protein